MQFCGVNSTGLEKLTWKTSVKINSLAERVVLYMKRRVSSGMTNDYLDETKKLQ